MGGELLTIIFSTSSFANVTPVLVTVIIIPVATTDEYGKAVFSIVIIRIAYRKTHLVDVIVSRKNSKHVSK